ncbi:MAG: hypothetical protein WD802_06235 [Gemmatimonadaceae bacterium]
MRNYERFSGVVFTLLAIVQVTRLLLQWPVTVAGFDVPLWPSAIAAILLLSFAIWAFRSSSRTDAVV